MISDYHTACVINGSSTTSPIPSEEIEEKLPPLVNYTYPAGTGIMDVRVQDNKAKSLRVAVWLHQLDMSLSPEEDASSLWCHRDTPKVASWATFWLLGLVTSPMGRFLLKSLRRTTWSSGECGNISHPHSRTAMPKGPSTWMS